MGYGGLKAAPIKFPKFGETGGGAPVGLGKGAKAPKAPKAPKAKKPRAKKALKVPKTLSYPRITQKNPLRAPTAGETAIGALGARRVAGRIVTAAKAARGVTIAETGAAAAVGYAAMAGALAYALTSYGLSRAAVKKQTRAENAARAADAYRLMRLKLAEDQGRPLTKTQLKQTATLFKNELLKLGLSTSDLSGLNLGKLAPYAR